MQLNELFSDIKEFVLSNISNFEKLLNKTLDKIDNKIQNIIREAEPPDFHIEELRDKIEKIIRHFESARIPSSVDTAVNIINESIYKISDAVADHLIEYYAVVTTDIELEYRCINS